MNSTNSKILQKYETFLFKKTPSTRQTVLLPAAPSIELMEVDAKSPQSVTNHSLSTGIDPFRRTHITNTVC